jgi:predicted RND superfamily exporter protein
MLGGELSTFGPFSDIHLGLTQVIIITRLHAMYQQSRRMLIFLVVVFLAVTVCCGSLLGKAASQVLGGKH